MYRTKCALISLEEVVAADNLENRHRSSDVLCVRRQGTAQEWCADRHEILRVSRRDRSNASTSRRPRSGCPLHCLSRWEGRFVCCGTPWTVLDRSVYDLCTTKSQTEFQAMGVSDFHSDCASARAGLVWRSLHSRAPARSAL